MKPYPTKWPKADPRRPTSLPSRITEAQKLDLYNRRITTKELAKQLNVHEKYLSELFPGKHPLPDTKKLKEARAEFREALALEIMKGNLSITQASEKAHTSYNTMQRLFVKTRAKYPELSKKYEEIIANIRRQGMARARNARKNHV